jgi:hypothetical protein
MSGESHSCLKFHVYVGVGGPEIAGVSRKRVQLSRDSLLSAEKGVATEEILKLIAVGCTAFAE